MGQAAAIQRTNAENPAPTNPTSAPVDAEAVKNLAAGRPQLGIPLYRAMGQTNPLGPALQSIGALWSKLVGGKDTVEAAEVEANAAILEDRAFEVLEVLTPKRVGEAEAAFETWFDDVEARAKTGKLDPMEHLTLLHVSKTGLFEGRPELERFAPRMEAVLVDSHRKLTGDSRPLEAVLDRRMPRKFVRGLSGDAKKIHDAIFASDADGFLATMRDFGASYIPSRRDAIVGVGVLAALFTGVGSELLGGAVTGYMIGTLIEHSIHKHIGHASPKQLKKLEEVMNRFGPLGRAIHEEIKETAFSHGTVHHGSYAGSYVDRFAPRDTTLPTDEKEAQRSKRRATMEKRIAERGPHRASEIKKSDYGRSLAHAVRNALMVAPVSALATLLVGGVANAAGGDVGLLFGAASVLTSLLFIPASNNLHPYLHMTKEEAFEKAGPLMKQLLKTGYVSHVAQAHYIHHRGDVQANQNLMPGADYVLGYEPTHVEAIVALRKLGTFY
ncbi:MAG: hypothetical protein RIT81_17225 [Deltaproteobacteria bacterium]